MPGKKKNLIFELRKNRLNLSQAQFAVLVSRSESQIDKLEAEVGPAFAAELAEIARKHEQLDLVPQFEAIARDEDPSEGRRLDLANLTTDEEEYLLSCLEIYRDPDPKFSFQVNHPAFVRDIMKMRREFPPKRR